MKPIDLTPSFRAAVREYPKPVRIKIGQALQQIESSFGDPHRHRGLGIRKLSSRYFEIRVGLSVRLLFEDQPAALVFVMAGSHDQIQKFLKANS